MTKPLVQGQIGYWVNGKLVHMPKKRVTSQTVRILAETATLEEAHTKRNRLRREQLAARQQRQKFRHDPTTIVGLKNASKSGDLALVLNKLKKISVAVTEKHRKPEQQLEFFRNWTGYIFVPDIEERTALYYASLTGQHHIVELYMSLYLMAAIKVTESNMDAASTFREWFSSLNGTKKIMLSKPFKLKDYDVCVLNSLNEQVRYKLTKQEFTIMDAMAIVSKALEDVSGAYGIIRNSIHARMKVIERDFGVMKRIVKMNKRIKSKRPMLNNRGFNGNGKYDTDDLWAEEDYEDQEEDYKVDTPSNKLHDINAHGGIADSDQSDLQDILSTNKGMESIREQDEFSEISMNQDLSITSSNIIDKRDFIDYDGDIVEDLDSISEFSILNNSTSHDCSVISLDELSAADGDDECGESTTQNWDVVSDLLSVDSIDTFNTTTTIRNRKIIQPISTSYKDMLLKAKKPSQVDDGVRNTLKLHTSAPTPPEVSIDKDKTMMTIEENDDNIMRDAHWERDGFKNGRGGKLGKLFKSNDFTN